MKFLLVFLVVLIVAWGWRSARKPALRERPKPTAKPPGPADMVACRQCGVHIPAPDSIDGALGVYCSDAHRQQAEG